MLSSQFYKMIHITDYSIDGYQSHHYFEVPYVGDIVFYPKEKGRRTYILEVRWFQGYKAAPLGIFRNKKGDIVHMCRLSPYITDIYQYLLQCFIKFLSSIDNDDKRTSAKRWASSPRTSRQAGGILGAKRLWSGCGTAQLEASFGTKEISTNHSYY